MNEFGYSPLHITKIMMAAIYIYIISTYRVSYMDECVLLIKSNFFMFKDPLPILLEVQE